MGLYKGCHTGARVMLLWMVERMRLEHAVNASEFPSLALIQFRETSKFESLFYSGSGAQ